MDEIVEFILSHFYLKNSQFLTSIPFIILIIYNIFKRKIFLRENNKIIFI